MATLFVLLIIGVCGGWEIVRKFFSWLGGLGNKQKSTCSAQKHTYSAPTQQEFEQANRPDLLDFDEFCDIMDEGEND